MADAPWFRFFASDWLNGTVGLTLSEIGLYVTLVAMMYDHGGPITMNHNKLARRCAVTPRKISETLTALIADGKIIETPEGLWNERVAKEIALRREKIQNAKEATAAREEKKRQSKQGNSGSVDDPEMIARSSIQNQKQNLEEEKEESCPEPAAPPPDLFVSDEAEKPKKRNSYPADFEQFWKAYPTDPNMSKAEAGKAWQKIPADERALVLSSVPNYRAWLRKQKPDHPVVHAVRYITQRRFEGHLATSDTKPAAEADWDSRLKYGREHKQWSTTKWGPMPYQSGCLAPPELLLPGDGSGWAEFKRT